MGSCGGCGVGVVLVWCWCGFGVGTVFCVWVDDYRTEYGTGKWERTGGIESPSHETPQVRELYVGSELRGLRSVSGAPRLWGLRALGYDL